MKKTITLLAILTVIIVSCEKTNKETTVEPEIKVDNLAFIESLPGGCALGLDTTTSNRKNDPDTVIYTINEDSLSIYVGFNAECGPDHSTKVTISNDTIYMFINRNYGPFHSCHCYYIYDFHFSGLVDPYNYVVNIDEWKFFYGYIEP